MPLIFCHLAPGLTARQKHELIREIALVTHSTLEVDIGAVCVVIAEHAPADVKPLGDLPADPDAASGQEAAHGPH